MATRCVNLAVCLEQITDGIARFQSGLDGFERFTAHIEHIVLLCCRLSGDHRQRHRRVVVSKWRCKFVKHLIVLADRAFAAVVADQWRFVTSTHRPHVGGCSSVWGIRDGIVETRAIDMHITRLRQKLRGDGPDDEPEWIVTVRGKGYMLGPDAVTNTDGGAVEG